MSILLPLVPGQGQKLVVSSTSVQSTALESTSCVVYSDVDCYVRQGSNPTAVADGADQFIPAGAFVRLGGITRGNKLAFISLTNGLVHLTPGA